MAVVLSARWGRKENVEADVMSSANEILNSDFFAPASTSVLDGLVAEYREKRKLIERFHGDFTDG